MEGTILGVEPERLCREGRPNLIIAVRKEFGPDGVFRGSEITTKFDRMIIEKGIATEAELKRMNRELAITSTIWTRQEDGLDDAAILERLQEELGLYLKAASDYFKEHEIACAVERIIKGIQMTMIVSIFFA